MAQASKSSERSKRDAASKLAEDRLSVLELAKELGNVAEACRRRGLDRTSFYEWKRRFQTQGFEGLKDLPPIHRSHPQTTPPETVARGEATGRGSSRQPHRGGGTGARSATGRRGGRAASGRSDAPG